MSAVAVALVLLVAALHAFFLVLEMFLWTTPRGRATFGTTVEEAETTKVLAANQGLYNGFLTVGLVVGLLADDDPLLFTMLGCVVAAGLYGAATVSPRIAVVQALPGALAIAALLASR